MNEKLIGRAILNDDYGKRGYEPIYFVCRTVIDNEGEKVEVPIMPFFTQEGASLFVKNNTGTRQLHVKVVDGYYNYGSEWQMARRLFAETAQAELSENDVFVCEKCQRPQRYCSANLDKDSRVILTCQYCGGEVKRQEIPKD